MTTLQMPAPSRSHEQRMGALRLANETRMARAELKRRIFAEHGQASRLAAARVLRDVPVEARRMKVDDLLRAVRGIGEQRSRRWRATIGASTSKTVGGLSRRQRIALVALLSRPVRGNLPERVGA
jgi:hypothetical protein